MHRQKITLILCFLLLLVSLAVDSTKENLSPLKNRDVALVSSIVFEEHTPIIIESDTDFLDYDLDGTGSVQDPYIIECLNITALGSQSVGISIRYTTAYFVVRDCFILAEYIGIECWDIADGTGWIVNNTCTAISWNGGGVTAVELRNCTIERNRCYGFAQGIHLNRADRCTITGNNISNSAYQGINIRYSDNNMIIYNHVVNSSQHGLAFVGTSNTNIVHHNNFSENANEETYRIDGERTGTITSQGYDEGSNNLWYDEEEQIGNWWSDYSHTGSYLIDGPSDAADLYPISDDNQETSNDYMTIIVAVVMIFPVVVVLIGYQYRQKIRRNV